MLHLAGFVAEDVAADVGHYRSCAHVQNINSVEGALIKMRLRHRKLPRSMMKVRGLGSSVAAAADSAGGREQ
jgi:hypothetical protein